MVNGMYSLLVIFHILTAASLRTTALWDITPSSFVETDRWREYAPLKRRYTIRRLHGTLPQKAFIFEPVCVVIFLIQVSCVDFRVILSSVSTNIHENYIVRCKSLNIKQVIPWRRVLEKLILRSTNQKIPRLLRNPMVLKR
jgi:hypothetical protein